MLTLYILYGIDYTNITNKINIDPKNIGKIEVIRTPFPMLKIEHINFNNNLIFEDLIIEFDILSILTFSPKLLNIRINKASLYLENSNFDITNHVKLAQELISNIFSVNNNVDIINFVILNFEKNIIQNFSHVSIFKDNTPNSIFFKGTLENKGQISGSVSKDHDISEMEFTIFTDIYNLTITENYKNNKLINGKGEFVTKKLGKLLSSLMPDLNKIFSKFNQRESSNIKFDISQNESGLIINNISIVSNSFSSNGSIYIPYDEKDPSLVNFSIPSLNFQTLLNQKNQEEHIIDTNNQNIKLNLSDKFVKSEITINKLLLDEKNNFENFKFLFEIENNILNIVDCSTSDKLGNEFKLNGNITQNSIRSLFDGNIYLKHNDLNSILKIFGYENLTNNESIDFILSSDLRATLADIIFSNIILDIDQTKLIGDLFIRFIGYIPHIEANFTISPLDLTQKNYPIFSNIIEFVKNLTKSTKNEEYLNKFIPIRTFNYNGNIDIKINNFKFENYDFDKVYFITNIDSGIIDIKDIHIEKNKDYIDANIKLSAQDLKPIFNFTINDANIKTDLSSLISSIVQINDFLANQFQFQDSYLNLNAHISNIYFDDSSIENIKLSLNNDNSIVNINNFEANIFGGKIKLLGNFILKPYSVNLAYAINSANISEFQKIFPNSKYFLTNGAVSLNGTILTNGNNNAELLYNLETKSNIIFKDILLNHFAIDDFIEKINEPNYEITLLDDDLKKYFGESVTAISEAKSNISLKNGIIICDKISFNSNYSIGSSALSYNLYDSNINLASIFYFRIGENTSTSLNIKLANNIFTPSKIFDTTEIEKLLKARNENNN
jgi:hypothetical protein